MLAAVQHLPRLITDPDSQSYYPAEERKSKLRISADLLGWLVRHRSVNTFYYTLGFDRRNGVKMNDYLPHGDFCRLRDARNLHPKYSEGYNYVCLLRDKFVFSQFASSLGFPTSKNLAICTRDSLTWLDDMRTVPLEGLLAGNDFDGFCKKLAGILGRGAFRLQLKGGKLFIDSAEATLEALRDRLGGQHLIQEQIEQHPTMSSLHPASVNTIRLVTFNQGDRVQAFSAALRVGANGRSMDNWGAGGILVGLDLASGRLREEGIFKSGYGGRVREHPQTGVAFASFEIPYFHDAISLAMKLHECLYGIHSIGWDLAITEDGPLIIEGNDDWDGVIPMVLESNFRERFLEMYQG